MTKNIKLLSAIILFTLASGKLANAQVATDTKDANKSENTRRPMQLGIGANIGPENRYGASSIGAGFQFIVPFGSQDIGNFSTGFPLRFGLDFNRRQSQDDTWHGNHDMTVGQAVLSAMFGVNGVFMINDNTGFGWSNWIGGGLAGGIANGQYNWSTGQFGIYRNKLVLSPLFLIGAEFIVRYKNTDFFLVGKTGMGPNSLGRNVGDPESAFCQATQMNSTVGHFVVGIRRNL